MPELPEVESIRRGLEKHLVGQEITNIEILDPRSVRGDLNTVRNETVTAVVRRGKYIWLRFSDSPHSPLLVAHLRMSGQLLIDQVEDALRAPARKHLKVTLRFANDQQLSFVDQRVFGYLGVDRQVLSTAPTGENGRGRDLGNTHLAPAGCGDPSAYLPETVQHIARDFLDPALPLNDVIKHWRNSRRPIKAVLLDQQIASGMGNIYADETLFRTGIDPRRRASALTVKQCRELIGQAQSVLREATAVGGTSFDALYLDAEGQPGYFARSLQAYGRAGKPCLTCGTTMQRLRVAGRGTHICPTCQPYGRK